MSTREQMREAIDAATAAMDAAIALSKQLGQHEDRDGLITAREAWTRAGNRAYKHAGPQGRLVVKPIVDPIVDPHYSVRPHLRSVPCGPTEPSYHELVERMRLEARRQARASEALLKTVQSEVPHAG